MTIKTDYLDQVISINEYGVLHRALVGIDQVYATMADIMMQAFLSVSDVCDMPLHANTYNKYINVWPQHKLSGEDCIKYRLLAKEGNEIEINIYSPTIKVLYDDYLLPYHRIRKKLFDEKYSKPPITQGYIPPNQIMWMTSSGEPVKPNLVEEAFRQTGLNIKPSMLRHTGITHTMRSHCYINKIAPHENMAARFSELLEYQLGYALSLNTTKMYIRTIMKCDTDFFRGSDS